jgi:hypothetical protein
MPVDISATLRQALSKLETEQARIDRQIVAVRQALQVSGVGANATARAGAAKRGRKRMSPQERKAVSARMKAFWAKRRKRSAPKSSKR